MANLLSTIITGGSGTTPTLSLSRNIATPSNYYNGLQLEVKATSGTAGIALHRNGYSHVGIYHDSANELKFNMNSGTPILTGTAGTIWGSGNDGAGSGLDADLIDGIDSSRIVFGDGARASTYVSSMNDPNQKSGFFFKDSPTGQPFGDWWNWMTVAGNSWQSSNNYSFQIAHAFHSDDAYIRRMTNGEAYGWRTLITSGNIGSQSVTYATSSTRLYASDSPYTYGNTNPYYLYMNYDGGSYWELKVSPATPGTVKVAYANSSGNSDTVDGYHASSLWRSDGGTWNPAANILLGQTGNNQEWSFDITRNGYTGGYWHVWDSVHSTMLGVDATNNYVWATGSFRSPQFRFTNSTNNAYLTGNSDWGMRMVNDNGYIQFGPANNSWAHIYSDKSFYFNQELYVNGTQLVKNSGTWSINVTGSAGSATTAGSAGVATYARRIAGADRIVFDVGGDASTFYPIAIFTGAGATENQYSEFIIERGGYEDPGHSGIGFSTFNARFTYKPSGWGYGATYFNLEQLTQTMTMLGDYQDYYQASQAIIWLRGGTRYWIYSIYGTITLLFGNESGTSYSATYNTFDPITSARTRATTAKYYEGSVRHSGIIYSGDSIQAPIFYDLDDTSYYGNFNSRSVLNSLQLGSAGSDTSNLKLDVQGHMAIRGSNGLFFGVSTNNYNSWTTKIYASGSTQYFNAQSFIFDNQGYGGTTFVTINGSGIYNNFWYRNYGAQGMYNESYGTHFYSNGSSDWSITGSGASVTLAFRSNHQSTIRGYVHGDTSNNIGFLNNGGSWSFRTDSSTNAFVYGSDLTIGMGGANATSINMGDGDEGARAIHCNSNRIGFLNQAGSWGSWCSDDGSWSTAANLSVSGVISLPQNPVGTTYGNGVSANPPFMFYQGAGNDDGIRFYSESAASNQARMVFEIIDDIEEAYSDQWVFRNKKTYGDYLARNEFQVSGDGHAQARSSMRAPIFYDSNDTGYYLDPNGTSNLGQLNTATRARWNMPRTWYDRSSRTSDEFYWTGTNGWGTGDGTWANAWKGGFSGWDIWGTGTDHPQGAGYVHAQGIVSGQHAANSDSGYGWMMVGAANATDNRYWLRGKWGTTTSAWTEIMTSNQNTYAWNMDQWVRTSDSVTFGATTSPTFLVNSHSDNTKGYRIHNTSGSSVSAMFTNSSNQLVIAAGAVDQINLNKKVYVNGVAIGVNVAPSGTAGRIDASNDIVAYSSSDERLKYNITPIENAIDKVKSLTGVEFDWKPEYKHAHGYEGHDTGIIAQQVQEVIPSAVRTNDTGFLAVRYEKLIGLLIEANKELAARVEELEKKLG